MKHFLLVPTIFLLSGCVTSSRYFPMSRNGGYADSEVDGPEGKIQIAIFSGNAQTNATAAQNFSKFRAYERCKEKGFLLPKIYFVENRTESRNVVQSTSNTYHTPTTVTGSTNTTNSNSTAFNGTQSGGNSFSSGQSWVENLKFPQFYTYYVCVNSGIYDDGLNTRAISASDMASQVKDLFGAIQVTKVDSHSPNKDRLQVGDFITKANGQRVQDLIEFNLILFEAPDKTKIPVHILREGTAIDTFLTETDVTEKAIKKAKDFIETSCKDKDIRKTRDICSTK